MLISEIESKNVGFVDTIAAFQRACAQSRLPRINVTTPSRLPTIKVAPHTGHPASVQIELTQSRSGSPYRGQTGFWICGWVQSVRNPIHQQRPKRKTIDFWNWNEKHGFRWHHGCTPTMLRTIKGYPMSMLPTIKAANHQCYPLCRSSSSSANSADAH